MTSTVVAFTSRYDELAEGCEHSVKSWVKEKVGLFLGEERFTEVA